MRNKSFELNLVNRRNNLLLIIYALVLSIIVYKIFQIQVINHKKYSEMALENVKRDSLFPSKRGRICDRNEVVLAYSRPYFLAKFSSYSGNVKKNIKQVSDFLDSLNILDKNEILKDFKKNFKKGKDYILIDNLEGDLLSKTINESDFFKNIKVEAKYYRKYPYPESFFHAIGYVGRVSKKDLKEGRAENYLPDDFIGKTGLESYYEKRLRGRYGIISNYLNALGRIKAQRIKRTMVDGESIKTTFDFSLQNYIRGLLKGRRGSVVVVDPITGEVLAMVSSPTFSSEKLLGKLSRGDVDYMYSNGKPLFNRALKQKFPPGSTIKPFLALGALEGGFLKPDEKVKSPEIFRLGKHTYRGWKRGGQGKVDIITAIESSADVFFYKLALEMGVDYMSSFLGKMGFGSNLGIEEYSVSKGNLPTREWKLIKIGREWREGDSVLMGIGQGYLTVTNMQLAMATSMLLNGGELLKPKFNFDDKKKVIHKLSFKKENVDLIKEGMHKVIFGKRGTARLQKWKTKVDFAGKTGTAQVVSSYGELTSKDEKIKNEHKDHSLFIGFAPFKNPEIVVSVFIENGGHGSEAAAPIARKVINFYLNGEIK